MSRAALALAATLFAAPAFAQASFSVAAGAALPMGDASDALEMGYNATVGLGIKPPIAPLGVRIEGMFNSFAYKDNLFNLDAQRIIAGTANVTLSGPALPMAYLIGGVGMYNSSVSVSTGTAPDGSTDFGFNLGAGLNFPLTGFSTFLEARYHHIPVDGGSMKFLPITFGIKF
jgi:hypothetical protein